MIALCTPQGVQGAFLYVQTWGMCHYTSGSPHFRKGHLRIPGTPCGKKSDCNKK